MTVLPTHAGAGMLGKRILAAFAQSVRAVADPVMGKALGEVSLGNVLGRFSSFQHGFPLKCSRSSICCKKP